jgi:chromosome segregation ATPase
LVDTLIYQIVIAVGTVVGALVGIQQLRANWIMRQEKSEERIKDWIKDSDDRIVSTINKNVEATNSRFEKDEEDIEDAEDDIKVMAKQFRDMCDQLSKHDYVITDILPQFRELKREFYKFKNAVDTNTKVGFTGVQSGGQHTNDNIDDSEHNRSDMG